MNAEEAVCHFDRLAKHLGDHAELERCRAFITEMTDAPRGISLRQIVQLAEAVRAATAPKTH